MIGHKETPACVCHTSAAALSYSDAIINFGVFAIRGRRQEQ
jgi:hypothetical protein